MIALAFLAGVAVGMFASLAILLLHAIQVRFEEQA